jgi:hypothetical protein
MIWRVVKESNPADRFWRPVSSQRTTRIGGRRSVSIHTPVKVPLAFEARVRPAHFTFLIWQRLSESNAHDPEQAIVGFKPTKHATCEPPGWRRADHSKAMPQDGTHRLATACRTLPASLSKDWSPTEDLHLTSPAYKAGAPLSVRDGQLVGRPGIAPGSLRLKGGSLSR